MTKFSNKNLNTKLTLRIFLISGVVLTLIILMFLRGKSEVEVERIIYLEAKLTPAKTLFKSYESPQFTLNLGEKREEKSLTHSPPKQVFAETEPEVTAEVLYLDNEPIDELTDNLEIQKGDDNQYNITLPQPKSFRPGKYQLNVAIRENGGAQNINQDFTWGVLAINTNKSIFKENEIAKIYFGVIDDLGSTVCDALLQLEIKAPDGQALLLSTEDGTIKYSGECARDNVTYVPDYLASYQVGQEGIYQLKLTAQTKNGEYQITDFFVVRKEIPFEIERIGPTRINPVAVYEFKIRVKANQDFEGEVIESVPDSFGIRTSNFEMPASQDSFGIQNPDDRNEKLLVWQANWKKGKIYELSYEYDAPDTNPEFHLLGPLRMRSGQALQGEASGQALIFEETRQWQIAVDGDGQVILLWDGDAAPDGWTCISDGVGEDFYDVFPRGAASYGVGTNGAATHTHTITYVSETSTAINTFDDGAGMDVIITTHTHDTISSPSVVAASNNPSYRSLKFIRSNSANPAIIPSGVIGIFDTTSLPTNWDSYTSQNTYIVRGGSSVGVGGSNTHTHAVSTTLNQSSSGTEVVKILEPGVPYPNTTHAHDCSGTSDEKDHQSPYVEVVFGKTNQDTALPAGLIAMFDTTAPSAWASVSDGGGDFNGNFIKGDSTGYGDTGGAVQHAQHVNLAMNCSATSDTTSTGGDNSPAQNGANYDHTHTATVSFSQDDNLPVYRDTIFAQKSPEISGIIYSSEGGSAYDCLFNPLTVRVKKNGAGEYTGTCTTDDGVYSVGLEGTAVDDILTVFLDEETEKAATVTIANSTSGHSGIDLYQNVVIVRHENAGPITNENLDQYDSGGDPDIKFTVTLSGTYNLEVLSGSELHVWDSKTFNPDGTVLTNNTGGVLHLDDNATAYLDTATSTIGNNIDIDANATLNIDANSVAKGNIAVAGTLTKSGSPTLTLRGTNNISGAGSISFNILAVGDATAVSATTISSSLSVTGGSLTTYTTSSIASSGTPTVTISGTGNIGGGSDSISFYNLTINGTQTLQSSITVINNVSVSNTLALNDKDVGVTNGDFATTGAGTITCSACSAGTVTLSGTGNIGGGGTVTVYNLTISGSYTLQTTTTANNDVSIGSSGSLALNDQDLTVDGGDLTTTSNGAVTCAGCTAGTSTVNGAAATGIGGGAGGITFHNLIIGGTIPIVSDIIVLSDLTANGTMSGSVNVAVNGTVAGTGTINMSGGTVEQRVGAAENFGTTSGSNAWTFSTLMLSNSSEASAYTVTTQAADGGITVSTLLQIGKAGDTQTTTLDAGNRTWTLSGTTGTPFDIIGSSVLTGATSTFSYAGDNAGGDTTVQAGTTTTYNNLIFNASETFNPEGTITANGDLTITTGILAMAANNLNVGSTGVTDSGDIAVAGSLTQSASGTTTVKTSAAGSATVGGAGTLTFYNLTIAPTADGSTIYLGSAGGQTITVSNNLTIGNGTNIVTVNADSNDPTLDVNGDFSIATYGTFQASQTGTFQVAKNFTGNGTFTHNSGTVTFDTAETCVFNGSGTPAITFHNFTSTTAGKTLQFTESKTFKIEGLFTITGQSGNRININSTTSTQWLVDHQGTENLTYAAVQNSGCAGGTTDITVDSTGSDQGNNGTCWIFQIGKVIKGGVKIKGAVRIK